MKRAAFALLVAVPALASAPPTVKDAHAFFDQVNAQLKGVTVQQQTADWIHANFITEDTERNVTYFNEQFLAYTLKARDEAKKLTSLKLDAATARMLHLLTLTPTVPPPANPADRNELAQLSARMEGLYGTAKACGKDGRPPCRDLLQLEEVMDHSRDWDELLSAWSAWHATGRVERPLYERLVTLGNQGAREWGYRDVGEFWRDGYDMPPADFEKETARLWEQVKPLYQDLHCYVRARLSKFYGKDRVPDHGPIPAHVLGNMWAQEWTNLYPLVEPYPEAAPQDVTAALRGKGYDSKKMVRLAESFFKSIGLDPLPPTFWERSLFNKPKDREVVCHASAWDVTLENDLRLKACLRVNEEDLVTAHHELGHLYYYHAYDRLPMLYQRGANEGFHEAIGDAISLSVTPAYLKKVGLLTEVQTEKKALINQQLKEALQRVAILPFALLIDAWRWRTFSGDVKPDRYNRAWWELRRQYQGIVPPMIRTEVDFDPGAKYHIAANVPYVRYYIARFLEFQLHRALCQSAGEAGPLYACSIYGSHEAGRRLEAMLAMGASKPWPDALEVVAGERRTDASAILEYFQPLQRWLQEQNRGQACGW